MLVSGRTAHARLDFGTSKASSSLRLPWVLSLLRLSDGLGKAFLGTCLSSVGISFRESCLARESPALMEPGSDAALPDSFTRQTALSFKPISVLFCVLLICGPDEPPRCPFESCSAYKHHPESTHRGAGLAVFTLCWGNGAHRNLQYRSLREWDPAWTWRQPMGSGFLKEVRGGRTEKRTLHER